MTADLVDFLVEHKADLNGKDPAGLTPLGIASRVRQGRRRGRTRQGGMRMPIRRIGSGYTPLMLAVAGHSERSAKASLDHGADVNAKNTRRPDRAHDRRGRQSGGAGDHADQSGADETAKDENGNTASRHRTDKGNDAVIKILTDNASAESEFQLN